MIASMMVFALSAFIVMGARASAPEAHVTLRAYFANSSADYVPAVLAGRSPVSLDLEMDVTKPLPAKTELVIHARELFSDAKLACRLPLGIRPAGEKQRLQLDIASKDLPLTPGCWHLLVDVQLDGKSLAGLDKGSAVVYARKADESWEHCRASYNLARVEFAWDRKYKVYYKEYKADLPPTGDPFDDANDERFRKEYITAEGTAPELQHDGGVGFLEAAMAYHAIGERERAGFCEKAIRRTADAVRTVMHSEGGKIHYIKGVAEKRERYWHSRTEDGFVLKLLCQAYFYFRFGPGDDTAYARELLRFAKTMYDYTIRETLDLGVGRECKVYDGRILSGIAWYALARKAESGAYPDNIETVLDCASRFARHCLSHDGWYDDGCYEEGECHIWCGNLNLLNGLLPACRIARDLGPGVRPEIKQGAIEAFRFITQTNGVVAKRANFVPTLVSQWAVGNLYELCDEYLRQIGPDQGVSRWLGELNFKTAMVNCVHRNNTSGALLMLSSEYRQLKEKPALPWDRVTGK